MTNSKSWCGTECNAGLSKLSVRYDGEIFPCDAFKGINAASLGNIYNECSLEQALENVGKNKFLSTIITDFVALKQKGQIDEPCPAQYYHDAKRMFCFVCKRCGEISNEEFRELIVKYKDTIFIKNFYQYIRSLKVNIK